ncbi:AI-2E family transporter [Marinospirillum alkaliphilum]|uniref:Putative permease n=1 Tax=Marinospirillum alkaliphilum DSM 21637 TaxID=1122209 RepID=A0A1K1W1I3_9GAMM|nr:AI-2E family transporter [Marinospirillum alkaliphilum]SFX30661.1 putative permease [Marinospirillum alkaliphilum DSM 21637]
MTLKGVVQGWLHRYFSDEEAVIFALLLIFFFTALLFFGAMLVPFLSAVVLAYLLQGVVSQLKRIGVPELPAVLLAFSLFIGVLLALIFWLLPLLWQQTVSLVRELPAMIRMAQQWLNELHETYPHLISQQQVNNVLNDAVGELRHIGQLLVSLSLASIPSLLTWLVYLILVPILVFFMLKDQRQLVGFITGMMPRKRALMTRIWSEMDAQIANYVRGKALEILIVAAVTWACFAWLGLNYAELLALLVGLSVLVPYIGAAVVTLPVALIALFQFGFSSEFMWVIGVYAVIQALDGNVLVPLLFSEAVNLHPVSIILAVLFFGGLWGFWGVFFAIPLATMIKAILNAWPLALHPEDEEKTLEASD